MNRAIPTLVIIGAVLGAASRLPARTSVVAAPRDGVDRVVIHASDLPKPYATPSADNGPHIVPRPADAALRLPQGFHAEVWAEGFTNPRWLTVAPNGDVLLAESGAGRVTLLRDTTGAGHADVKQTFAEGLHQPFGLAIWKDSLYVGNTDSVVRFRYHSGQERAEGAPEVVVPDLPHADHGCWTRNVIFNPHTGKMYVSVGCSADEVVETDPHRASILEYNADGSGMRTYASGIRNPVGLAFQPVTGALWTAVNERDFLGDDLVPDYCTAVKDGGFYGWPYYYLGPNHDPRVPEKPELAGKITVPDVLITSHSAPLGMMFYTGKQFPAQYRGDAFVALHGSANRAKRTGYDIIRIPFKSGKPAGGYEQFCSGWMLGEDDKRVWGRPVGLAMAKDGSILMVDDGAGKVWRIWYAM